MKAQQRLAKTKYRSMLSSRSHAFMRWWEAQGYEPSNQATMDLIREGFYAGFTQAWTNRQEALDGAHRAMRDLSTRIRELERRTPTA